MHTEVIMTNKLKQLTWDHHQAAERRKFARELIKGSMSPALYHKFLCCQYLCYQALEDKAIIPPNLHPIKRSPHIFADIRELEKKFDLEPPQKYPKSVDNYIAHIEMLWESGDNEGLLAHMYVRHFGELHGGQIIKKRTPGAGKMYEFDADTDWLISEFRNLLNDDMADEAKKCFDFASELFDELSEEIVDSK
jgi:heme oxygenase